MSQDSYPSHRSHFCIWTLWNQVIFSAYKSDNFFSHYFSLGQCYNSGTWLLIGFIVLSYLEKLSGREADSVQKKAPFSSTWETKDVEIVVSEPQLERCRNGENWLAT